MKTRRMMNHPHQGFLESDAFPSFKYLHTGTGIWPILCLHIWSLRFDIPPTLTGSVRDVCKSTVLAFNGTEWGRKQKSFLPCMHQVHAGLKSECKTDNSF